VTTLQQIIPSSYFSKISILFLKQYFSNNTNDSRLVGLETCELYIKDSHINSRQYLDEYDSKCLEFKNLNL